MSVVRRQKGVTLVETLVALAVLGLVAGSVLILVGQNTRFAAAARDRTYASIAADNVMVRALALSGPIETGEAPGEIELGDRIWPYRVTVTETGVEQVYRIDIDVLSGEGGQVLASATSLRRSR